jgi:uncharacterized protein YraI
MRKHVLVLTIGVLLALTIPAVAQDITPTPATAAPAAVRQTASTDLFVTTQFRVNVRSGPGLEYTRIGILTFADSLDITGQNADATWLRVNFNGQEGWVAASVVQVTGDVEGAPVVEAGEGATLIGAGTPAPTTDSGPVTISTRYNTNLRSSFSTSADILTRIPFNTELVPEGRTNDSNWLMVTFDDQTGWVYAPILFFASGSVETLPILGTVALPEPSAAATEPVSE